MPGAILKEVCFMIYTIIIVICTVINTIWGFYWINEFNTRYKAMKRIQHFDLCTRSIKKNGVCPQNCKVCAWGDAMTERQLIQEKRTKKFYKEIMKYHRRNKHE